MTHVAMVQTHRELKTASLGALSLCKFGKT